MRVLRTPEDRFADLPDFAYPPRYADVGGLRMAYVEAGPPDGEPVLLLHGEPSWSFLYRTVMPVLADAGLRAIAPDLVGFGRSDKPPRSATTATRGTWSGSARSPSTGWTCAALTLVGQDWGGLIGLRLAAEHPDRFARVVAANTGLPTGDQPMPEVWLRFREVVRTAPALSVSRLVQSGCQTTLPTGGARRLRRALPRRELHGRRRGRCPAWCPTTPDDPGVGGQPRGLAAAGRVGQAVPGRVQRPRPDHRRDGARPEGAPSPARPDSITR